MKKKSFAFGVKIVVGVIMLALMYMIFVGGVYASSACQEKFGGDVISRNVMSADNYECCKTIEEPTSLTRYSIKLDEYIQGDIWTAGIYVPRFFELKEYRYGTATYCYQVHP